MLFEGLGAGEVWISPGARVESVSDLVGGVDAVNVQQLRVS